MKRFIVAAVFALTSLVAFSAAAVDVFIPNNVVDRNDHNQQYWCQAEDLKTSMCSLVSVSDDTNYVLIKDLPGVACEDNSFGVINTVDGVGENIEYDGGQCKGDVKARFVRGTANGQLYVQIYNSKKVIGNYPVH
ncbi:hypothetical protein BIZ83_gp087 [Erwinia phage vB_EamM_ChrisDB]|uniref:hypothetical protein n=1 Tax=Erwinia phage vB_EamM_ChrisDB TaxID=1883371 RepID=UPI00081C332D|nr:hypothetical protein BIZ83_gp087 [Erwinia phage vB_EamM_ChrisDB]ANZ48766.1 hypothetical protein CHRISDB_204 [Erwinia phage vB_EamM_ChrisDB]